MAASLSLGRQAGALERAASAAARRFILRSPDLPADLLPGALRDLESAADEDRTLWSPAVNAHWLASFLGQADVARRILAKPRADSPFAAAYFARRRLESGDAAAALALVQSSPPAPDAHMRTELALAAIHANILKGDLSEVFEAYARRMAASDGDRDRQHVVIHFLHVVEALWETERKGFTPPDVVAAAEKIAEREPAEAGHWWTIWGLLSTAGRRRDTIDALLRGADRFPDNASHVEFLVSCAWRALDAGGPAKPN